MGPDDPKVAPRWAQSGPKMSQEGPKMPQEGPRGPQDSPRRAQDEAKMAQHGASDSELKPKGHNNKNFKKQRNNMFFEGPGLRIGPT